jgi:hypothetical protein
VKVVFATPSLAGPTAPYIAALEKSIPVIVGAGWEEAYVQEVGCPYISHARANMTRKALDAGADVIVYLDYDLSWDPSDLLTLLEAPGDVVAGTYRFKKAEEEYMGAIFSDPFGLPLTRPDGCIKAARVPAGFLKVTRDGINRFMGAYPELLYGPHYSPSVDLFNHGAHRGTWWGEDYAFCRRWTDCGGEIWLAPNLNIAHHAADKAYPGNYHEFLMRQPGGVNDPARKAL